MPEKSQELQVKQGLKTEPQGNGKSNDTENTLPSLTVLAHNAVSSEEHRRKEPPITPGDPSGTI